MIFVWGYTYPRRHLGRVADFCPACRERRAFILHEVRRVYHLYFLPLGEGSLIRHEKTCAACGQTATANLTHYDQVWAGPELDLDTLTEATNAGLFHELAVRQDRQERALTGQATAAERLELMLEPFLAINPAVQARARAVHMDPYSFLGLAGVIVAPCFLVIPGLNMQSQTGRVLIDLGIGMAAAGLVCSAWALATDVARFIRREFSTLLAEELAFFDPTLEELQQLRAVLRERGLAVGNHLTVGWLHEQIAQVRRDPQRVLAPQ